MSGLPSEPETEDAGGSAGDPPTVQILIVAEEAALRRVLAELLEQGRQARVAVSWLGGPAKAADSLPMLAADRPRWARRLAVPQSQSQILYLETERIDWIEAANQYVRVHTGAKTYLLRGSMADLESRLDPWRFLRIHRSFIVNVDRVQAVEAESRDHRWVVLTGGQRLPSSARHLSRLQRLLLGAP